MTDFDSREKAFEKKFEMDEEMRFKIASRTARLFGLWVADKLGLTRNEAEAYVGLAVESTTVKSGRDGFLQKVEKDLQAKNVSLSRHHLEREWDAFYHNARDQIAGQG